MEYLEYFFIGFFFFVFNVFLVLGTKHNIIIIFLSNLIVVLLLISFGDRYYYYRLDKEVKEKVLEKVIKDPEHWVKDQYLFTHKTEEKIFCVKVFGVHRNPKLFDKEECDKKS